MKERIAIVEGIRTPFCKAAGSLKQIQADDLGAYVVRELVEKTDIGLQEIDEVIMGNVAQPIHASNVARVIALKACLPESIPAFTVNCNCASAMEAISTASDKILSSSAQVVIAGGSESMSNIPLIFGNQMTRLFDSIHRAKSFFSKLQALFRFRPHFLKPIIGIKCGLTDPVSGLIMGLTAENLSREFHISRKEQDLFALESHKKAVRAQEAGIFQSEILPLTLKPDYKHQIYEDEGPRKNQSLEALQKLKPYFDPRGGTVTVGNACPITDGACALILMTEKKAKSLGMKPLGYIKAYAYAGLNPARMGLGPTYATKKLLDQLNMGLKDIDLIEINEAFAAQVIANQKAFASNKFAQEFLGKSQAIGEIDPHKLNVNGGAIALGHPVGASGARLVLTQLKEMNRRKVELGLATLCVGGGQGAAMILEANAS